MTEYIFEYYSTNASVIEEGILAYHESDQSQGILIDLWRLVITYINSQDLYFVDFGILFIIIYFQILIFFILSIQLNNIAFFLILESRYHDFDMSMNYYDQSLQYDVKSYTESSSLIIENYLFVFLDSFWPITQSILYQLLIYVCFIIIPWVFINLNFIAIFLLQLTGKPYYYMMLQASKEFFIAPKYTKSEMCKIIYRFMFTVLTLIIMIILTTDFIYLLITQLSKSNFQTTLSMKQIGAVGCYLQSDQFMNNVFSRDRGLSGVGGRDALDCIKKLENQEVDVVLISEFSLLYFIYQNPQYYNNLRFQFNLNQNIEHLILVGNSLPDWFKDAIQQAIDKIVYDKLDLLVRDKYLPNQIYNNKIASIIPNDEMYKLIFIGISLIFILIIQVTSCWKQWIHYKKKSIFKSKGWILNKKIKAE